MEVKELVAKSNAGEITAFIGNITLDNLNDYKKLPTYEVDLNVKEYFLNLCSEDKFYKALQVVELNQDVLKLNYKDLSIATKNKLAIVEALVVKDSIIIFENIHKCLTYREIQNVKRVLRKLAEYNKNIILLTNDIEFLFNLTKKVVIVDNNEIKQVFNPVDWFNNDVYKYISKTPIIEFVSYCRSKNIKIEDSIETKELLKAIYRSVHK